jgi:transposase
MSDELFDDVERARPGDGADATASGAPRYETANRTQLELLPLDLEGRLPQGHPARLVWRFVEGLDLSAFYAAIAAREGRPGRPAIDPRILVALWLFATIEGVGSARELDRLCDRDDAYRWLRGGVSVNYHTLSDFRVAHQAALDALLTQSITVLLHKQVVTLRRVAQDGTKVRASAGIRSFRRRATLEEARRLARQQVRRTAAQVQGEVSAREAAAQQRALADRLARVDEALAQLPEVEAVKARNRSKSEPRTSTTDPDARVMKMRDGGFRPAYNVQFATDVDGQAVLGVAVTTTGTDCDALIPMLDQIERRTGRPPAAALVDGGYVSVASIGATHTRGVTLYAPVPTGRHAPGAGPRGQRDVALAAWRARMATPDAQAIYRTRASTAERINADAKTHRTLGRILVRGVGKVMTWALWVALAVNAMRVMGIVPHRMG